MTNRDNIINIEAPDSFNTESDYRVSQQRQIDIDIVERKQLRACGELDYFSSSNEIDDDFFQVNNDAT